MEALLRHLVEPLVEHRDAIQIQVVEGEAVILLELSVHPSDQHNILGDDGRNLRNIRTVLSAAAGSRKATVDLVDDLDDSDEE